MGRFVDLTGQRFGRLMVTNRVGKERGGSARWACLCDCGAEHQVSAATLSSGRCVSCGCWSRETNQNRRAPDGVSGMKALISRYHHSAKKRGLFFRLNLDEFHCLTVSACHYCGAAPSRTIVFNNKGYTSYRFNGIDRKNNSIGYVLSNCVPCCTDCNNCKGSRSYDEFLSLIRKIFNHINPGSA
jgi:5-methylcytosine-specific restriction endonuclease McrA